jgi:hypothetical protein
MDVIDLQIVKMERIEYDLKNDIDLYEFLISSSSSVWSNKEIESCKKSLIILRLSIHEKELDKLHSKPIETNCRIDSHYVFEEL